ncbi:RagB/SusD family nutrient uptake outer membrane protein [Chitinophaga sedimenti]|uniref:RagB/SusD family nutrient uptake outer membrane protein n=1 Tax=Chitinophaga sedimenti TaxID=2033606 RepID=UPI002006A3D9|nr:RagB/SusD family nutrient uptake outer membrane protein [Chitinophaga sedimenti]MCK7553721.1 RagB/SusD family nutrient uptake outer membrane protein [Chitinophaga sedimenti]
MKKSFLIYAFGALVLIAAGCRKYVEVEQPGRRVLKLTSDYDALLNSVFTMNYGYSLPPVMADDFEVTDVVIEPRITNAIRMAYTWSENVYGDLNDADWDRYYKQIYVCNQITDGVMTSEGGTEEQKRATYAEARVFRAAAYLDLVNMYAKHYNEATAATDLGVPLVLRAAFEGVNLTRASVKNVYAQIKTDLLEAMPYLPPQPFRSTEASQMAAFGLLTRAHLYMGAYEDARRYADSALKRNNQLLNLAPFVSGTAFPPKLSQPEVLFLRVNGSSSFVHYAMSRELQALFTPEDLRWRVYTVPGTNYPIAPTFAGRGYVGHRLVLIDVASGALTGPSVPEMLLTKAECLARDNKPQEAIDLLNMLRQNRFLPAEYQPLVATTADEALRVTLEERRRELMWSGTRWFDQKRLNQEPRFAKTVTRTFLGETYTLAPNSNRYVLPIATKYIQLNPEIQQNPR